MKTVLALRHAKSSWKDGSLPDHERPLNKRGQKAAPMMGKHLKAENLTPNLIVSSTAVRARSTAEAAALTSEFEGDIRLAPELYMAGPEAYVNVLRNADDQYDRVMVVGHCPGIEEFVERLTGEAVTMPTAAVAHITLPIDRWSELDGHTRGELLHVWRPKEFP